jgi:hypothetical protein
MTSGKGKRGTFGAGEGEPDDHLIDGWSTMLAHVSAMPFGEVEIRMPTCWWRFFTALPLLFPLLNWASGYVRQCLEC